jgi:hypothetical protein
MLATDITAENCMEDWTKDIRVKNGKFIKTAGVTVPTGTSGIPEGWTVEEVTV